MEVTLGGGAGAVNGVLRGVISRIEAGFDDVAAAESPCCAGDFGGEDYFDWALGGEVVVVEGGDELFQISVSSGRMLFDGVAKRPVLVAFWAERCLPESVRGPVEASAFCWLAAIWAGVVMSG